MPKKSNETKKTTRSDQYVIPEYMQNPYNRISITVIGVGGNGTHVLGALCRLNWALRKTKRSEIIVSAVDYDIVTETNVARQLFYPSDIGKSKSQVLIERINRSYGYDWIWHCDDIKSFNPRSSNSNIFITCSDNDVPRIIAEKMLYRKEKTNQPYYNPYWWIDTGNNADVGQIILTDREKILPSVFSFREKMKVPMHDTPSCSTFESLKAQGLYMNSMIGTLTGQLLWDFLTSTVVDYNGFFINLVKGKVLKLGLK